MLAFGLVGGWRLQEGSGQRSDVLGQMTLSESGGTLVSAPGKIGSALNVESGKSLVNTALGTVVPIYAFSLACWVNWTSGGSALAICLGQSGAQTRPWLGIDGTTGKPRFSVVLTSISEGVAVPGNWTHIALTYDGSVPVYSTYQDGVLIATHNTLATFATPSGVVIGSPGAACNILIDEAYMWNRTLSAAEIATLCGAGNSGLSYPFSDGKSLL